MPFRTPRMPLSPRRLLPALLIATLALPAAAEEAVSWPSPWTPGQVWTYRSALVETDTAAGEVSEQRITGSSTLRLDRDDDGLLQVWSGSESRVEAVRGDRAIADMMAGLMQDLDRIVVELRLDRAGRAGDMRNLAQVRSQVRAAMDQVLDETVESTIRQESPDLPDEQRDMLRAMVRPMMVAEMDALINDTSVRAMLGADFEDFNAFTGADHAVGRELRASDPMYTPISGQALAAVRAYRASRDPDRPDRARIDWTTNLDQDATAEADLWTLAAEIASEPALKGSEGRPLGLDFVEEGRIEWRPADGAILSMKIVRRQRYGQEHQSSSEVSYSLAEDSAASTTPAAVLRSNAAPTSAVP